MHVILATPVKHAVACIWATPLAGLQHSTLHYISYHTQKKGKAVGATEKLLGLDTIRPAALPVVQSTAL